MLDNRVAGLVVGRDTLLFRRHDAAAALRAEDDALDGFFEIFVSDGFLVTARGHNRCLVDQVFKIGA